MRAYARAKSVSQDEPEAAAEADPQVIDLDAKRNGRKTQ